tara:strand:- start:27 stop:212 length:186 start_codon:yes stop_codon:yes gene_type:complete
MYVVLKEVEYSHIDNTYSYQYQSESKIRCQSWINSRIELNILEEQKEKYTIFKDIDDEVDK